MRLRHIPGAEEAIASSPYVIQQPAEYRGRFHELFCNHKPIRIEVGMGKGRFIMEMAARNPQVNFIGIERYSSVLLRRATRKRFSGDFLQMSMICRNIRLNLSDKRQKNDHYHRTDFCA